MQRCVRGSRSRAPLTCATRCWPAVSAPWACARPSMKCWPICGAIRASASRPGRADASMPRVTSACCSLPWVPRSFSSRGRRAHGGTDGCHSGRGGGAMAETVSAKALAEVTTAMGKIGERLQALLGHPDRAGTSRRRSAWLENLRHVGTIRPAPAIRSTAHAHRERTRRREIGRHEGSRRESAWRFVGQRRAGDAAAQLLRRPAVLGVAAHGGVQAETVHIGAKILLELGARGMTLVSARVAGQIQRGLQPSAQCPELAFTRHAVQFFQHQWSGAAH